MGYIAHQGIAAEFHSPEQAQAARELLVPLMRPDHPDYLHADFSGQISRLGPFLILGPDGSKEGWAGSELGDARRAALRGFAARSGAQAFDYECGGDSSLTGIFPCNAAACEPCLDPEAWAGAEQALLLCTLCDLTSLYESEPNSPWIQERQLPGNILAELLKIPGCIAARCDAPTNGYANLFALIPNPGVAGCARLALAAERGLREAGDYVLAAKISGAWTEISSSCNPGLPSGADRENALRCAIDKAEADAACLPPNAPAAKRKI